MAKTAIITGAAGAIAGQVIEAFNASGWQLGLLDRAAERTEKLRDRYPEAHVYGLNLADEQETRRAVEEIAGQEGSLDALLNIAGGFSMQTVEEGLHADYERMFGINFITLFNTVRAALPIMKRQDSGFILGVAAAAAEKGGAGMALYAASKAAVTAYLRSLQAELRETSIRTSILFPMTAVDTPANRQSMPNVDPNRWISPDEIAEAVQYLATRSTRGHVRELKVYTPHAG